MRRILHGYEQVDGPYNDIVTLLKWRGPELIRESFEGDLRERPPSVAVHVGNLDLVRDVEVTTGQVEAFGAHTVRLPFSWKAAEHARWFPSVDAALEVTALSTHPPRTELAIIGSYAVPLGIAGTIADGLVGHAAAEQVARDLLVSIRDHITEELNALPSLVD